MKHGLNLFLELYPTFFFFFFGLFRASPTAYGISQARGAELQLPAYNTATATPDPQPTEQGQDQTHVLMDASWVR